MIGKLYLASKYCLGDNTKPIKPEEAVQLFYVFVFVGNQ